MRWIEDSVFSDTGYEKKRKELERKSEELIKKYSESFRNEQDKDEFRRIVKDHLSGNCNKSNGEIVSDYLMKIGLGMSVRTTFATDPDFYQFMDDLKGIHDEFLEKAIEKYESADTEDLEKSRMKEIQMYGSLISGLISNSKNVKSEGNDSVVDVDAVTVRREELIPRDKLFEYGKKTLKVLSKTSYAFPKNLYEDLIKTLKERIEDLVKMSPDEYLNVKTIVLNDQKIKQDNAKRI